MSVSEKATHRLARIPKYVSINKRIRGNVPPGSVASGPPRVGTERLQRFVSYQLTAGFHTPTEAPVIDRHRDEASSASGKCILDGKFGHAYNSSELRMCLCA